MFPLLHCQRKSESSLLCIPDSSFFDGCIQQIYIKRARPGYVTCARIPLFNFDPHITSNWSAWKCLPDFLPFQFVFPKQLVSNVLELKSTPVAGYGASNGTWEQPGQANGLQRPQRGLGTSYMKVWTRHQRLDMPFHTANEYRTSLRNLQLKQAINQQHGVCQDERWLARSFSGIVTPVCMLEIPRRSYWQMLFGAGWTSPKPGFISPPNITESWHERRGTNVPNTRIDTVLITEVWRLSIATCPWHSMALVVVWKKESGKIQQGEETPAML